MMLRDLNLDALRRIPRISYYFRYPLHYSDFHELREQGRLRGHYTAKPLHGRLTPKGRVDRSASYRGDVAALFVPVDAQTTADVRVVVTHMAPRRITLTTGRRNWPAIRMAAEQGIRDALAMPLPAGTSQVDLTAPELGRAQAVEGRRGDMR